MINYTCDKCGGEMITKNYYCEITVNKVQDILIPAPAGKAISQKQMLQLKYHLCQKCGDQLTKDFKQQA